MPFTPAHAAAALPFRRTRLTMPALVVGTFAPDFEYFLLLAPRSGFGHSLKGIFLLSLPLGFVVLLLFHYIVRGPLIGLLPDAVQQRLPVRGEGLRMMEPARLAWIVGSLLLGITTHVLWDAFTHAGTWMYQRWPFLRQTARVPLVGLVPHYKLMQHGSTLAGVMILSIWIVRWYRTTQSAEESSMYRVNKKLKLTVVTLVLSVAFCGAMARAIFGTGFPRGIIGSEGFTGEAVCTFVALVWWELVAYGLLVKRRVHPQAY